MQTTTAEPRRLVRDRHDRVIGGVAGGLGRYFNIDPVFFRVAFVVLSLFGGTGLALYFAGWLLVPGEGEERSIAARALATDGPHRKRVLRVLIVTLGAVVLFNLVLSGPWWSNRSWAPGGVALVAAAIAVSLVVSSRRHVEGRSVARLIGWMLATVAVAALITLSGLVAVIALSDAPLRGGIGDRHWRPVSAGEVRPAYRMAIGDLAVDLSEVRFRSGTTRVAATVGVGHLRLRVPSDVAVSVSAHSGAGTASIFGDRDEGMGADRSARAEPTVRSTGRRLVVDAEVGVGEVEVVRAPAQVGG